MAVVVVGVLAGGVAADQDPGHRPVTGQAPARLGGQRPHPASLSTHRPGLADQAVQIDGDQQLGPDPTGLGQPAPFQLAAGQLSQGIGLALAAAAGVVGVGRAGQRVQGSQQGLAGLSLQQPLDRDHPLPGRGDPQPPPRVLPRRPTLGPLGIGHLLEVAQDPPQPGWVQASGRFQEHWFGHGGGGGGQVGGAGGQHLGMGERQSPAAKAWAVAVRGPRNKARAVRTLPAAALAPMRNRARSQLAVEAAGVPWSAPAAPRPSTAASRCSQCPSSRSSSRRS